MGSCPPSMEGFTSGNTSFLVMNPDFHFFNLSNGRHRVHRRDGECSSDQCVYESDRFGAGSVMVLAVLEFVMLVALRSKLYMGQ